MSLSAIHSLNKQTLNIAITGDSTVEGGWPRSLQDLIDPVWGTCNDGVYFNYNPAWSFTAGWTDATNSNAWDVGVFSGGAFSSGVKLANGSTIIATWTKPSWLPTITDWQLLLVDGASAGAASYSTDGGSTWTGIGVGFTGSNNILTLPVSNKPITTTLKVRGASGSGTAVNTYLLGMEPLTNPLGPTVSIAASSGEASWSMVRTTSGDWTAWWDLRQPKLAAWQFSNDAAALWAPAQYEARLNDWIDVIEGNGGEVVIISFGEQNGRSVTDQAAQRVSNASVAASRGYPHINICELWGGSYATANAQGYMIDDLHPSDLGMEFIAAEFWKEISRDTTRAKRLASA